MSDPGLLLVPCTGFVFFLIIISTTIVLVQWFKHREMIAMIQKGILPEHYADVKASRNGGGRWSLGVGITLVATGVALTLGLWPLGAMIDSTAPLGFGPWMLLGLIPLFLGLGLLIYYAITRKGDESETEVSEEPVSEM